MRLMVYSKSTERYIDDWRHDDALIVSRHPTEAVLDLAGSWDEVIAIGGGSVIDTAKIISRTPVIAVPTTFAGASRTSHAVYWEGERKLNFETPRPVTIQKPEYLKTLPEDTYKYSKTDCICHALESLISKKATTESRFYASIALELVNKDNLEDMLIASLLAADAFEITGTNLLHALSYPLTAIYGVQHGRALLFLLPRILPYIEELVDVNIPVEEYITVDADLEHVVEEALSYQKIFETRKTINKETLIELLKAS